MKVQDVEIPDTIQLTFKCPDALWSAVEDMENIGGAELEDPIGFYSSELSRWLEYGEIITVEFNLKEGTARVVEKNP